MQRQSATDMQVGCGSKQVPAVDYVEIESTDPDATTGTVCYTRALLKSALLLAGCKTKIAHKAAKAVFQKLGSECEARPKVDAEVPSSRRVVTLTRRVFEQQTLSAVRSLSDKSATGMDIQIACSIREQRSCVVIMLAGTSGTGKSTLASLLAAKMGITTMVSTDSIRHMLRSFTTEEQDPILWASTYQAGDLIPQLPASPTLSFGSRADAMTRTIKGYKVQCEGVLERVVRLVAQCEARCESMLVEGVHLSMNAVIRIMGRHPCVLPFLVDISNENKHRERFAVRAKYMTLDPGVNRYVKHFRQIRIIQNYLVRRGERHCIPTVDNTNVDRSVATIHATVLSCLRRRHRGEVILDMESKTAMPLSEDYKQCLRDAWSSKGMLQLIRSRKSASGEAASGGGLNGYGHEEEEVASGGAEMPTGRRPGTTPRSRDGCPCLDSSDAAAVQAAVRDASSSGTAGEDSTAEQRVEGASVTETEVEEQDDDDHSEPISARSSRGHSKRHSPRGQG